MSRQQTTSVELPPHVTDVLNTLAREHHQSKKEIVRQGILLLDSILRGQVPPDTLATMTRTNFGKEA